MFAINKVPSERFEWLHANVECEDDAPQEAVVVNIIHNAFPVQFALNGDKVILPHICKVHSHQWGCVVDLKRGNIGEAQLE